MIQENSAPPDDLDTLVLLDAMTRSSVAILDYLSMLLLLENLCERMNINFAVILNYVCGSSCTSSAPVTSAPTPAPTGIQWEYKFAKYVYFQR